MHAPMKIRSVATVEERSVLGELMVEPESTFSDAQLYAPNAGALLLVGGALLLSPRMPEEPESR